MSTNPSNALYLGYDFHFLAEVMKEAGIPLFNEGLQTGNSKLFKSKP